MSVRDYLVCDGCGASVPLHDDCKGWSHLEVYDGGRGMELHFCSECTERIIAADYKEGANEPD